MDLSVFSEFGFDNEEAWEDFLFANGLNHQRYIFELQSLGVDVDTTDLFDCDTDSKDAMDAWLQTHYRAHQVLVSALGLPECPDLTDVHFNDVSEFASWLDVHMQQHQLIDSTLNL